MYCISNRTWYFMSAVIGVCGLNFCSFIGDRRRVTNGEKTWELIDDNTQKVFKLNNNVLFGMTGLYYTRDNILDPISSIQNLKKASVKSVVDAVISYINKPS